MVEPDGPDGLLGRALANPVHYGNKVFVLYPDGEWSIGGESELSSHHPPTHKTNGVLIQVKSQSNVQFRTEEVCARNLGRDLNRTNDQCDWKLKPYYPRLSR